MTTLTYTLNSSPFTRSSRQVRSYLDRVHERSKELKHPKPLGFAAEVRGCLQRQVHQISQRVCTDNMCLIIYIYTTYTLYTLYTLYISFMYIFMYVYLCIQCIRTLYNIIHYIQVI